LYRSHWTFSRKKLSGRPPKVFLFQSIFAVPPAQKLDNSRADENIRLRFLGISPLVEEAGWRDTIEKAVEPTNAASNMGSIISLIG
jgi:hypothetical protein